MNQIIHIFSKVVSCTVAVPEPSKVWLWLPVAS